jgi:hypothetical protein
MIDFPGGSSPGLLGYLFAQELCERLERHKPLPPGESTRIWAKLHAELQNDHRALAKQAAAALVDLKRT